MGHGCSGQSGDPCRLGSGTRGPKAAGLWPLLWPPPHWARPLCGPVASGTTPWCRSGPDVSGCDFGGDDCAAARHQRIMALLLPQHPAGACQWQPHVLAGGGCLGMSQLSCSSLAQLQAGAACFRWGDAATRCWTCCCSSALHLAAACFGDLSQRCLPGRRAAAGKLWEHVQQRLCDSCQSC